MDVKRLRRRAEKALQRRKLYDSSLQDVHDYVMPYRARAGEVATEGHQRGDKMFDATATKAQFRFAGRVQRDLTPLFQNFFSLEAGAVLPDGDEKKSLTEEFQKIGVVSHAVLMQSAFHMASHEFYLELYAGTAHMLIEKGTREKPLKICVPPVGEVALEENGWGEITGWIWPTKIAAEEVLERWPEAKGKLSDALSRMVREQPDDEVEVTQYTYLDKASGDYKLVVWTEKCDETARPIYEHSYRVSPWVTCRFLKMPGEVYGWGPAQLAMPFIKTTNKARELAMKAAAIALMGIYTRRNDGVFNPSMVEFKPLAMWPVAYNGGALGPTVQRLPVPQDFDISSVIIAEERENMKQALLDDALPPETAAVRSATEIAERINRLSQDMTGVYGRLTLEIIVPLVMRVIDILEDLGVLRTSLKIDQLLTQVRVIAPIAVGQHAAKVQSAVNWLEIALRLGGQQGMLLSAKVEEMLPDIGRWLGIEEKYIRSNGDKGQIMQMVAQMVAEAQAQEQAAAQPPEPPQQQFVNGGPV